MGLIFDRDQEERVPYKPDITEEEIRGFKLMAYDPAIDQSVVFDSRYLLPKSGVQGVQGLQGAAGSSSDISEDEVIEIIERFLNIINYSFKVGVKLNLPEVAKNYVLNSRLLTSVNRNLTKTFDFNEGGMNSIPSSGHWIFSNVTNSISKNKIFDVIASTRVNKNDLDESDLYIDNLAIIGSGDQPEIIPSGLIYKLTIDNELITFNFENIELDEFNIFHGSSESLDGKYLLEVDYSIEDLSDGKNSPILDNINSNNSLRNSVNTNLLNSLKGPVPYEATIYYGCIGLEYHNNDGEFGIKSINKVHLYINTKSELPNGLRPSTQIEEGIKLEVIKSIQFSGRNSITINLDEYGNLNQDFDITNPISSITKIYVFDQINGTGTQKQWCTDGNEIYGFGDLGNINKDLWNLTIDKYSGTINAVWDGSGSSFNLKFIKKDGSEPIITNSTSVISGINPNELSSIQIDSDVKLVYNTASDKTGDWVQRWLNIQYAQEPIPEENKDTCELRDYSAVHIIGTRLKISENELSYLNDIEIELI